VVCLIGIVRPRTAGPSWMTQLIAAQSFGLSAIDIPTIAGACFLLLVVAMAATLVPARRATGVDPVVALRQT